MAAVVHQMVLHLALLAHLVRLGRGDAFEFGRSRGEPAQWGPIFAQADAFATEVEGIIALRDALSPATALDVDEMGVILPDDNDDRWTTDDFGFPAAPFWSATAAFSEARFHFSDSGTKKRINKVIIAGEAPIKKWIRQESAEAG